MDHPFADSETNQLLTLIDQFNRICNERYITGTDPGGGSQIQPPSNNGPQLTNLNDMFAALFGKIFNIIGKLKEFANEEGILLKDGIATIFAEVEPGMLNVAELLVRMQTNISNERRKAEELISYLQTKSAMVNLDDPCRDLLENLKNLESMYTLLKAQRNSAICELDLKTEQFADRENDMLEVTERLIACSAELEKTKNELLSCEGQLNRRAADAAEAKAKCEELKKYADLAVEQTSSVIHERDQAHRLIEHLQSRVEAMDRENLTLSGQLKDTAKLYSELSIEHSSVCAELGRAAEKERETEQNVNRIIQECAERVQCEVERVRSAMQHEVDVCKADNDRLCLEVTEWKLKFDQVQRDYRNIDAMYEQLHASVANATQNEAAEKVEAVRRAAAAECARDEALFVKQQQLLKIEKLELALSKLSERCNNDSHAKQTRIDELQRQVASLSEDSAKCCHEKTELERAVAESKERCIEIEMQYRYKVKTAEDDAKTTILACDAKLAAAEEAYKKTMNNLARELNARQAVINRMVDDKQRRCGEVEEKLENVQQQLQEEQGRNRELNRYRADQARRIDALEHQVSQQQRQYDALKAVVPRKK